MSCYGEPEIKYLLQDGMSRKESSLTKYSGAYLDTSLAWRTLDFYAK